MTKYQPRNDLVLVLPDDAEKMRGTLIIPESAVKLPTRGTVVAVGPGYIISDGSRQPLDIKEHDRIDFAFGPGTQSRDIDGVMHFLMRETDVVAIVTQEPIPEVLPPTADEAGVEDPPDDPGVSVHDRPTNPARLIIAAR
jgi:chaperonin GroES